jgi:DNA-binding transcriptional regulator YiaG
LEKPFDAFGQFSRSFNISRKRSKLSLRKTRAKPRCKHNWPSFEAGLLVHLSWRTSCGLMKLKKKPRSRARSEDRFIGKRIRARRVALDLTLLDLARRLGVTLQQVQKYEAGENRVSAVRLFDICEALGVSLDSMFRRKLGS